MAPQALCQSLYDGDPIKLDCEALLWISRLSLVDDLSRYLEARMPDDV